MIIPKDTSIYTTTIPYTSLYTLNIPKPSGWQCHLFGMGNGLVIIPEVGNVPNFFWRWMQFICFGNKWTKKP